MKLPARLQKLWRDLGIPADYAQSRNLPLQREARKLTAIGRNSNGRLIKLAPRAAAAWRQMRSAANEDGIELLPISGFRSTAHQTRIVRAKLATGKRIHDILRFVAAPGCSEHHTGCALDIGSPDAPDLDERFAETPAFNWLKKNAARFGFHLSYPQGNLHDIGYEPWHWLRHS